MITAYAVKKRMEKSITTISALVKLISMDPLVMNLISKPRLLEDQADQIIRKVSLPEPLADWMKAWAKYGTFHEGFIQQIEIEGLHKEKEQISKRLNNLLSLLVERCSHSGRP